MKIHGQLRINGKRYAPGSDVEWFQIYPLFLIGLVMFATPSYFLAYGSDGPDVGGIYAFGIFAIALWLVFYFCSLAQATEVRGQIMNAAGMQAVVASALLLFANTLWAGEDDLPSRSRSRWAPLR